MFPTTSTVGLSDSDSKETLLVNEEETNDSYDTEVSGEVVVDAVAGAQREPSSSVLFFHRGASTDPKINIQPQKSKAFSSLSQLFDLQIKSFLGFLLARFRCSEPWAELGRARPGT